MLKPWLEALADFEGRYSWMYLDGDGNVTTGVGCALQTRGEAVTAFAEASASAQWAYLRTLRPGMGPHFYEGSSTVRMTERQIDQLLGVRTNWSGIRLAAICLGSDSWPACVRDACKDIIFNTGGLRFPQMISAIRAGDWTTAAAESKRIERPAPNGIQPERNAWTRDSILAAIPSAMGA